MTHVASFETYPESNCEWQCPTQLPLAVLICQENMSMYDVAQHYMQRQLLCAPLTTKPTISEEVSATFS